MARTPTRLGLSRDQLASFLNDFEQIKQFENLFASVDQMATVTVDDTNIAADNAASSANQALAEISSVAQETALLSLAPPDLGGTVTRVGLSAGTTGLTVAGTNPITTSGTFTLGGTLNLANGGTGATTASGARVNIGATTVGGNFFTLANPSAITFPRINADNTISALDAASFRTAIGAGTGGGSVTSVDASGGTTGLTFSGGPITTSGTLTLGGTLGVANGGTGAATLTSGYLLKGNGTSPVSASVAYDNGSAILIGTTTAKSRLTVSSAGFSNAPVLGSPGGIVNLSNPDINYGFLIGVNSADGHAWLQAQRTDGTASAATITLNEAGGNVAIGKSTAATALDVNGTVTATAFTGAGTGLTGTASSLSIGGNAATATTATSATTAGSVTNAVTFNNGGAGDASGTTFNGSAARTISYNTIGAQVAGTYVTSVTGTSPVVSSGGTTPAISMAAASASVNGYLTSTDWTTFNNKGSGTVTSVTGTAPVVSSGGTTPAISMAAASASVNGYLTSTDWTTFNSKGSGTVTSVTGTAPVVSSGGATPAISMAAATTSVNGYLTSTDWTTFNGKQAALVSGTNIKTVNGTTLLGSGDLGTIAVAYGGTGATTTAGARTNLGAAASGANTDITALDQDVTVTATGTIAADTIGFRGLPQNAQTSAYTLVLDDQGKHIFATAAAFTITIPANATTAFPVGTEITIFVGDAVKTLAPAATVTLILGGTALTGNRTLAINSVAKLLKLQTNVWVVWGAGVT